MAKPSASRRARPTCDPARGQSRPRRPSAATVTGPRHVEMAPHRVGGGHVGVDGASAAELPAGRCRRSGRKVAAGNSASTDGAVRPHTTAPTGSPSVDRRPATLRGPASAGQGVEPPACAGSASARRRTTTSESSRSCSSSGAADVGRRFGPHPCRRRRDRAGPGPRPGAGRPRRICDGPGPALLEGGVVEEGVGLAVQDLVGEDRRLGRLHEVDPDRARSIRPSSATRPSTSMASCRQS